MKGLAAYWIVGGERTPVVVMSYLSMPDNSIEAVVIDCIKGYLFRAPVDQLSAVSANELANASPFYDWSHITEGAQ